MYPYINIYIYIDEASNACILDIIIKMLAIFHKAFVNPPEELSSPASASHDNPQLPQETLKHFLSSNPTDTFSMTFGDAAVLAYVTPNNHSFLPRHQRYILPIFLYGAHNGSSSTCHSFFVI